MVTKQLLRRFLTSLAIVILYSLTAGRALAAGFPDTNGTVYADAFAYLQEEGVIQGYNDGYGRPDSPLNRVEALKVILESEGSFEKRIAALKKNVPSLPLFADVDQRQWYVPYLEAAFEKSVITGYPDNTFRPAKLLTTEEAITILMRTFGEQGESARAQLSPYIENQANQWYTASVNAAVNRNLIMHSGKLRLGTTITRGQFFDMVYRLHSIKASGAIAYEGVEPESIRISEYLNISSGNTGVTSYDNRNLPTPYSQSPNPIPSNVSIASGMHHEYASEKYFAISMPSIGISDLTITHPQDAVSKDGVLDVLKLGVGHLFAYPGGGGKIMIYGHSSGYPWDVSEYTKIFRKINELKAGDKVYVTYAGTLYIYEVTHEQTVIAKNAGQAFQDNGEGEELILFTCWPPDSIAQRYLVHAVPVETVAVQ